MTDNGYTAGHATHDLSATIVTGSHARVAGVALAGWMTILNPRSRPSWNVLPQTRQMRGGLAIDQSRA